MRIHGLASTVTFPVNLKRDKEFSKMTRTEIKDACVDEWMEIDIRAKKYYLELGYQVLRKNKKNYFKVHPWDLSKGSGRKISIRCTKCGKVVLAGFVDLMQPNAAGKCVECNDLGIKHNNIGFNKYGLEIIEYAGKREKEGIKRRFWVLCTCHHCGSTNNKVIESNVLSGNTRSCGCLRIKEVKKTAEKMHRARGHRIRADFTDEQNKKFDEEISNFYKSPKWKEARKPILEEETCICCGAPGNTVHHTYSRYFFRAFQYNQAHLVLLCPECHAKYHNSLKFNCSIPAVFEGWLLKEKEKC